MTTIPQRQLAASVPTRQLAALIVEDRLMLDRTIEILRKRLTNLDRLTWHAALAMAATDGWPLRLGEGGRSNDVSDPVGEMATGRTAAADSARDFRSTISVLLAAAETFSDTIIALSSSAAPMALTEARKEFCHADITMDDYELWGRKDANGAPIECGNLMSVTPTGRPDRDTLCTACYQRRRYHDKIKQQGFS